MRPTILALTLALSLAGGAWAQTDEDEHAAHHPKPQLNQSAEPSAPPVAPRAGAAADLRAVEDLMSRIQQTSDSAQRAELLRQHALALREQIRAMRAASAKRMAMMGGAKKSGAAGDDPHAAHKAAAGEGAARAGQPDAADGDDPHVAHERPSADVREGSTDEKGGKKGMMGGGMMKMHEGVERRLDAIERVLEQLIEREVVETGAR